MEPVPFRELADFHLFVLASLFKFNNVMEDFPRIIDVDNNGWETANFV